jgi:hypothetical protein
VLGCTTARVSCRQASRGDRAGYAEPDIATPAATPAAYRVHWRPVPGAELIEGASHTSPALIDHERVAWTNARKAANLGDFQLRDLRHEAASRFDEAGVPIV